MQPELPLFDKQEDLEEVAVFCAWLYQSGKDWYTAATIGAALGHSDRKVRLLASASRGLIVSGPGCKGYKHVRHCDPDEIATVTNLIERQAKSMAHRATEIRRAFHHSAR